MWNLELRYGYFLWNHVIQISIRQMNFWIYIAYCEYYKSLMEIFTSHNQILTSEEQFCVFNMDFYI
jgi:hypothetical protein